MEDDNQYEVYIGPEQVLELLVTRLLELAQSNQGLVSEFTIKMAAQEVLEKVVSEVHRPYGLV